MGESSFKYVRRDGSESFEDGRAVEVPWGVVLEMWGGECAHHWTTVASQGGTFAARLTSSVVDSLEIPSREWKIACSFKDEAGFREAYGRVCSEAAEIVGKHCDYDSRKRIRDILHKAGLPPF